MVGSNGKYMHSKEWPKEESQHKSSNRFCWKVIEDYPDEKPFPAALFLGWFQGEPFHVVSTLDSLSGYCFVITVYRPDLDHFEADYKTRR